MDVHVHVYTTLRQISRSCIRRGGGRGAGGGGVSDVNELCETALNSCLFVLMISLCGIVVFICVCSIARTVC